MAKCYAFLSLDCGREGYENFGDSIKKDLDTYYYRQCEASNYKCFMIPSIDI